MHENETRGMHGRYQWPAEAWELLRANRAATGQLLPRLITTLSRQTGNPRHACWRFLRRNGFSAKSRTYRQWNQAEKERLLHLIESHTILQIATMMRRSEASVRAMLKRNGASCIVGKDWFTKYSLAQALKVHPSKVQEWIDRGWLKTRVLASATAKRTIIDADEFCRFCQMHRSAVIGRRLNADRLDFIQQFVCPASHAELLPVRESKKERAAYDSLSSSGDCKPVLSERGEDADFLAEGA